MAVKGLGSDIVELARIREVMAEKGQRFLDKVLTKGEKEYCKQYSDAAPHVAGRFAAKEAVVKALGCGFGAEVAFLDIEILKDEKGKPTVFLSEKVKAHFDEPIMHISITHSREHAFAVAIWDV
jgi:holo-[acyl-carrier protein] synthase